MLSGFCPQRRQSTHTPTANVTSPAASERRDVNMINLSGGGISQERRDLLSEYSKGSVSEVGRTRDSHHILETNLHSTVLTTQTST